MTIGSALKRRSAIYLAACVISLIAGALWYYNNHVRHAAGVGDRMRKDVIVQAVLTRALAIEAPEQFARRFGSWPQGLLQTSVAAADHPTDKARLWSLYFRGALIKLSDAQTQTSLPLIFYYNPISDVSVVQGCERDRKNNGVACRHLCAFPGAKLDNSVLTRPPPWLSAKDPIGALEKSVSSMLTGTSNTGRSPGGTDRQALYCEPRLQTAAEVRLLDAAQSLSGLDASRFTLAVAKYLSDAEARSQNRSHATDERPVRGAPDPVIAVLAHLKDFSLSGAARVHQEGWLVFLTPKKTGWRHAVLFLQRDSKGDLLVRGVRLLQLSTH
jgi:hypothetical protein